MLINATRSAASSTRAHCERTDAIRFPERTSNAGGVLDSGIRRVPPCASLHLMCGVSVVQLLALVRENAAD